jgi:hypothetical protein
MLDTFEVRVNACRAWFSTKPDEHKAEFAPEPIADSEIQAIETLIVDVSQRITGGGSAHIAFWQNYGEFTAINKVPSEPLTYSDPEYGRWYRQRQYELHTLILKWIQQTRRYVDYLEGAATPNQPAQKFASAVAHLGTGKMADYDLFLSHAFEDKAAIARPLYSALIAQGVSVWFDEAVLELGDSLRRKIDEGLARCRFGVVILSPAFLSKQWTQRELDGLVARETASGEKAILPIWHQLDRDTLLRFSPPLADRLAGRSEEGIPALVEQILRVL